MSLLALPKPPSERAQGRVHRIKDDEEGEAMPKGIYNRKPKDEAANDAPDLTKPLRKARKPRAVVVVAETPKRGANGAAARFDVSLDLRAGAVTINAAKGSLTLAPDEVLALFAFLGRR